MARVLHIEDDPNNRRLVQKLLGAAGHQVIEAEGGVEGIQLAREIEPDLVLVDGLQTPDIPHEARPLIKGDATSAAVAAASILAKVTRDRLMRVAAATYPGYDFEHNKGYPCPRHRAALHAAGPSAVHRRSWAWMDDLRWSGVPRRRPPDPQGTLFT